MKKLLINAAKGLIGITASSIITALITGQPLTGLTKVRGLYQTFIQSSVPAWAFALVFLFALFGIYYALTHLPKSRAKGKVHFISDAYNTTWSKTTDEHMDVRLSGTFTYDGPGELIILKAFLQGTHPTTDIMATVDAADGSGRSETVPQLWLEAGVALRAFIWMRLKPVVGTPGKPLRRKVVFRDKFTRDFVIGPIDFPCIGK